MPDYLLEIINTQAKLETLAALLSQLPVIALDIETVDWWDRFRERVALIQIAFRTREGKIKVAVIDALAPLELEILRTPLSADTTIKAIHNAVFDAGKLFKFYKLKVAPIYDTMRAARQSSEKKYSLAAQAAAHLNLNLDKSVQKSDWSRRPLNLKQIDYAARDAFAALLLYEYQMVQSLKGSYHLKNNPSAGAAVQTTLDFSEPASPPMSVPLSLEVMPPLTTPKAALIEAGGEEKNPERNKESNVSSEQLSPEARAVLSVVSRMPDRYSPERLAVSVGAGSCDRVGLAGWLIDQAIGRETDFDEATAKLVIGDLLERRLMCINEFQKLEATEKGLTAS